MRCESRRCFFLQGHTPEFSQLPVVSIHRARLRAMSSFWCLHQQYCLRMLSLWANIAWMKLDILGLYVVIGTNNRRCVVTIWDTMLSSFPVGAITDHFCVSFKKHSVHPHNFLLYLWTCVYSGFIMVSRCHLSQLVKFSLKIYGKAIPVLVKIWYILKVL